MREAAHSTVGRASAPVRRGARAATSHGAGPGQPHGTTKRPGTQQGLESQVRAAARSPPQIPGARMRAPRPASLARLTSAPARWTLAAGAAGGRRAPDWSAGAAPKPFSPRCGLGAAGCHARDALRTPLIRSVLCRRALRAWASDLVGLLRRPARVRQPGRGGHRVRRGARAGAHHRLTLLWACGRSSSSRRRAPHTTPALLLAGSQLARRAPADARCCAACHRMSSRRWRRCAS